MKKMVMASIAASALLATSGAHAETIYWSLGVNSPAVGTVISNSPPVLIQPSVIYTSRPHVVYAPVGPEVIYSPPPVTYKRGAWERHHHHHRHGGHHKRYRGNDWDDNREYHRD